MTIERIQKTNFNSGKGPKSEFAVPEKRFSIVTCFCGLEILVVPDLRAMNRAIKNHLAKHKRGGSNSVSLDFLEAFLTEQILIEASRMNLPE